MRASGRCTLSNEALLEATGSAHRPFMGSDICATVSAVLAKTPEWVRTELSSKDATVRVRAEEALAAMIADALGSGIEDR